LLFDKLAIRQKRLSRVKRVVIARSEATKQSLNVVARIVRSGPDFSMRYTYEGFNKIYDIRCNSSFEYKLRRISSRNKLTHRILKVIIEHQREYLKTGNPIDLVPFSQVQLVKWINKSLYSETQYASRSTQYDVSWTSRLVNRLSVITPSGEEKPLRCFFQTCKDINKRLIKQLLDREDEDVESGKLKNVAYVVNSVGASKSYGYGYNYGYNYGYGSKI